MEGFLVYTGARRAAVDSKGSAGRWLGSPLHFLRAGAACVAPTRGRAPNSGMGRSEGTASPAGDVGRRVAGTGQTAYLRLVVPAEVIPAGVVPGVVPTDVAMILPQPLRPPSPRQPGRGRGQSRLGELRPRLKRFIPSPMPTPGNGQDQA